MGDSSAAQVQGRLSTALREVEVASFPTVVALELKPENLGCAAPCH